MAEIPDVGRENTFSFSKLGVWRTCRQKFQWMYVDRLKSPGSMGQRRGTAGHRALDFYYSKEKDMGKAIAHAWDVFSAEDPATASYEEFEQLESALKRYGTWSEKNDFFTWVQGELEFKIPFPGGYVFHGFIDGLVRMRGANWLLENKFNKRVETSHLDADMQVSSYLLAAHILGLKPVGVFFNIVRMGDGPTAIKEPVVRREVYRNPEGLQYFASELVTQMKEVHEFETEGGYVYRNLTKDCSWSCPFYQACLSINDSGKTEGILEQFKASQQERGVYELVDTSEFSE